MASQSISLTIVYSTVYSGADQRKKSKLRVTDLCAGNWPVTGEFPTQRASNAESVSIWWRHHGQSLWLVEQTCWRTGSWGRCLRLKVVSSIHKTISVARFYKPVLTVTIFKELHRASLENQEKYLFKFSHFNIYRHQWVNYILFSSHTIALIHGFPCTRWFASDLCFTAFDPGDKEMLYKHRLEK